MPGTNIAQLFAQQQGNAFSGSHPYGYQPALRPMQANPLAAMGGNVASKGGPATAETMQAMAKNSPMNVPDPTKNVPDPTKYASQDNGAQRLSSAGESSGVGFKHDDEGHLTGSSAFDSLDGYMKKAGLNSFQTQFFTRMVEQEMPEALVVAAIKSAGDQFGEKVGAELEDGWEKMASWWRAAWNASKKALPFLKKQLFKPSTRQAVTKSIQRAGTSGKQVLDDIGAQTGRGTRNIGPKSVAKVQPKTTKQFEQLQQTFKPKSRTATSSMREVYNNPSLRRQVANRSIEPTGLSRAYHGAKGALGDMFGPKGPANDAGAVTKFLRQGGGYNPINWLAPGRDARLGMANAVFNPKTGYMMPGNEGMYTNEDGSWNWRNIAANAAGNYLAAKTPIGARAMRRGMMGEGAGAGIGLGTGLAMNAAGYDVDTLELMDQLATGGYYTGAATAPMSKAVTLKNINTAAKKIPGLRNAANKDLDWLSSMDRFRNKRMFGSDRASVGLNRKPAQSFALKEIIPKTTGVADAIDVPGRIFGTATRATGLAGRKAKEYAMNNPGKAFLGTAGTVAGTGGAAYLGGKANNALNVMNETEAIRNQMARDDYARHVAAQQQLPPGQQPGGSAPGQQPGGAPAGGAPAGGAAGGAVGGQQPGGAPGQPPSVGGGLRQVGSGIYDTIESMFPNTGIADWINENKYMLMLGALGIGGGAMMGGGQGALLGGLATPLAYMLMKDQGLFDALDAYMGIPPGEAPTAPGSAGAGPGDVRDEMAENQQGDAGQQSVPGQQGDAGGGIPGDADGDGTINKQEAAAIATNPGQITALVDRPDRIRLARQVAEVYPMFAAQMRLAANPDISAERIAGSLGVDKSTATKIKQLAIQLQQQ